MPLEPISVSKDGPISLPCDTLEIIEFDEGEIAVDWSQLVTEATQRAKCRELALRDVEEEHSNFLRKVTGGATTEERDTWNVKEAAARAYLDGNATESQTQMLTLEAEGRQQSVASLAALVVEKAEQFRLLVGLTAKLRAAARQAVVQATDGSVPIANIPAALAEAQKARAAAREAALSQM